MLKQFFICSALLVAGVSLYAQEPIYPVRKNHKSAFMGIFNQSKNPNHCEEVSPYCELIGSNYLPWNFLNNSRQQSPFLLFEKDGKVGLIDGDFTEILPNRYKRIRPLSPTCFAVEIDSLFTVVDLQGKPLIKGVFSDICPLVSDKNEESNYFLVQRNRRWGIYRREPDSLLFEPRFAVVEMANSEDLFKVKETENQQLWGLADRNGRMLLDRKTYSDILVLNRDFIAVKFLQDERISNKKNISQLDYRWRIYSKNKLLTPLFFDVMPLTSRWAALVPSREPEPILWNIETQTQLERLPDSMNCRRFWRFDDQYILIESRNGKQGLLDNNLKVVVPPAYDSIRLSGEPGRLKIQNKRRWGLLSISDTMQVLRECVYLSIDNFSSGIAWVTAETGIGAINRAGFEIEKPMCKTLSRPEPDKLKGTTAKGAFVNIELGIQGGNIVRKEGSLVQGIPVPENKHEWVLVESLPEAAIPEVKDYEDIEYTAWSSRNPEIPESFFQGSGIEKPVPKRRNATVVLFSPHLFAVSKPNQTIRLPYLAPYRMDTIRTFSLYTPEGKALSGLPLIVGYRPFKENYRYTAFIDERGQMGLIDRHGQQLLHTDGKPVRYTYIGPFQLGRARVCMGGNLIAKYQDKDNEIIKIMDAGELMKDFQMESARPDKVATFFDNNIYYVERTPKTKAPLWGFVDRQGQLFKEKTYDFVHTFQWVDSLALIANYSVSKKEWQYGAVDTLLLTAIEPKYMNIERTFSGYRVEVKSIMYYFNPQGHQICISPKTPKSFSEGLCGLRDKNDRYGFIDTKGVLRIDYKYKDVHSFSEGLAAVREEKEWSFIDSTGNTVFKPAGTDTVDNFSNGRCRFSKRIGKKKIWGYYNKVGKEIIEAKYSFASNFSHGAAVVRIETEHNSVLPAIIDTNGLFLKDPTDEFSIIRPFDATGRAMACQNSKTKEKRWVVIDQKGTIISDSSYSEIEPYAAGFAKVRRGKNMGLINLAGKLCVPLNYESIGTVSEGLVAVKPVNLGKWIYVDTLGQPSTVRGAFTKAGVFQSGAAVVDKSQLINKKGEKLLAKDKPLFFSEGLYGLSRNKQTAFFADGEGNNFFKAAYDSIIAFRHGIARVQLVEDRKWGMINRRGLYVIAPKYAMIHPQDDGNFAVNPQRYFGLLDRQQRLLLEPEYDRILIAKCDDCVLSMLEFSREAKQELNKNGMRTIGLVEYNNLREGKVSTGLVYRVESGEKIGYFMPELPVEKRWIWPLQN